MSIRKTLTENKGFFSLLVTIIAVKSSIIDWNYVPTGSMRPTLADGDQILINKLAYDVTIPLTYQSIYKFGDPERGDIVVFDTEKQDVRMVKRVLAVPGDTVKMRGNKIYMNDQVFDYEDSYTTAQIESNFFDLDEADKVDYEEDKDISDIKIEYKLEKVLKSNGEVAEHGIRIETGNHLEIGTLNMKEVEIPEGHYLMIGDNRNNSFDSRFWGLVERDEIVGKVDYVVFSLDQDHYLKPRMDRLFLEVK